MGTRVYKRLVGTGQGTGVVGPPVLVLPCGVAEGLCSPLPPIPAATKSPGSKPEWAMLHGTMPGHGTRSTADTGAR